MQKIIFVAMFSLGFISNAIAGSAANAAQTHFKAIADGDLQIVMCGYGAKPQLNWVGGPLDGTYTGSDDIPSVWEKFTKSYGRLKFSYYGIEESANPKDSTVTANVQFEGNQPIKVRCVLTYREEDAVSQTWQNDLNMAADKTY